MIERRTQAKGKMCATYARTRKGNELEKEYAALSKEIKKSVRRDDRAYADRIANEAQVAANHGNIKGMFNPYPTAFPYGNGMVLHFYQQQESSTTKTVHKVINKGLKTYV